MFATDIDDPAIATARLGRYPTTLLEGLSDGRRDRFFRLSQGSYVVSKEIRELCTFSTHNLVRDPPFSRMGLVSCRNLLIYMDRTLQAAVIPVFHYSLAPRRHSAARRLGVDRRSTMISSSRSTRRRGSSNDVTAAALPCTWACASRARPPRAPMPTLRRSTSPAAAAHVRNPPQLRSTRLSSGRAAGWPGGIAP